jgi:hypothetical protein
MRTLQKELLGEARAVWGNWGAGRDHPWKRPAAKATAETDKSLERMVHLRTGSLGAKS